MTTETKEWQQEHAGNRENKEVPCPRNLHVAVTYRNEMWIHGGKSNGYHADMYRYQFSKRRWQLVTPHNKGPLARFGHRAVVHDTCLFVFGGYDQHGFTCDTLHKYNFDANHWERVKYRLDSSHVFSASSLNGSGTVPNPSLERYHHDCAQWAGQLVLFGGKSGSDEPFNDLWALDLATEVCRAITVQGPDRPTPRWGHSLLLTKHGVGWLFGGRDKVAHFGDTWRVTLTKEGNNSDAPITARWTKISTDSHVTGTTAMHALTARYFHSAVLVQDKPVRVSALPYLVIHY